MTHVTCACGVVEMARDGPPILAAECHCTSCREAAARLGADVAESNGRHALRAPANGPGPCSARGRPPRRLPLDARRGHAADYRVLLRQPGLA